jgi:hypothetical protein
MAVKFWSDCVIIDIEGYMAGLVLPLMLFLGLFSFKWPGLRFSLSEYRRDWGYTRRRRYFNISLGVGAITSVGLAVYVVAEIIMWLGFKIE